MTLREHLAEILGRLPELVSAHLVLSTVAIALGAAISLPLGIAASRRRAVRGPVLASVGLVQAIPGIALLALMVPLLVVVGSATTSIAGIEIPPLGFWPALLALTLYSMLPMVRNTVTGLESLDPAVLEAATAMGMTRRQRRRLRWRRLRCRSRCRCWWRDFAPRRSGPSAWRRSRRPSAAEAWANSSSRGCRLATGRWCWWVAPRRRCSRSASIC